MIIRAANKDDADAIGLLWRELVDYHLQLADNMPVPAKDGHFRYAQRIRYGISDPTIQTYVAEENGQLLGYVYGTVVDILPETFIEEYAGLIADIYVKAEYRHLGVGKALMQAMKDWFKLRGVSHYEWYVAAANQNGIEFWQNGMGGTPLMIRMRATLDE